MSNQRDPHRETSGIHGRETRGEFDDGDVALSSAALAFHSGLFFAVFMTHKYGEPVVTARFAGVMALVTLVAAISFIIMGWRK